MAHTPHLLRLAPLLTLVACTPAGRAWWLGTAAITTDPESLDMGPVRLGESATRTLGVLNEGTRSTTLNLAVAEPFSVDRTTLSIGAGGSVSVAVSFRPTTYADATAELELGADSGERFFVVLAGSTDPDSDGDGHSASATGGDDCDDTDPTIHPTAAEICYDAIDNDCDGLDDDSDCDGDGYPVDTDCDDADPLVSPGATETGPDGTDEDCDGLIDEVLDTYGALVFTEIRTSPDVALELCNASTNTLYLDNLVIETAASTTRLDPTTARDPAPLPPGGCAAFSASDTGYFTWEIDTVLDGAHDALRLLAGDREVDAVVVGPNWSWGEGLTYSLVGGGSATTNDRANNWCLSTTPSWGSPNPADPCP